MARYFDGRVSGHVVMSREGSGYRADCSLHLSSGINLQAEGEAQEPYASFEHALDKIERRLRRYKTRLKEHQARRSSGRRRQRARLQVANYMIEAPDEAEEVAEDFNPVDRRGRLATAQEPVGRLRRRRTRSQRRAAVWSSNTPAARA